MSRALLRTPSRPPSRASSRTGVLRRFAASRRGVAAVEFALILPFMAVLYLGMAELTRAVGNSRKITMLARTLADLTARGGITAGDNTLSTIFGAGTSVLAPYSGAGATMVISSFGVTQNGSTYKAKVCWSKGWKDGRAPANASDVPVLTVGATSDAPDGYKTDKIRFIRVDVAQTYAPMLGSKVLSYVTSNGVSVINFSESTIWPVRSNEKKNASDPYPEVLLPDGSSCSS